jgi:AhpD family alkylhydroperoxidase
MTQRLDHQKTSPEGARALGSVYQYLMKSGLSTSLLALVFLRASQINGCAYCIAMHSRELLGMNVGVEKLMLLSAWREAKDLFSGPERAALQWTESVTLIYETGAPDADYQAAAAQFNEKEMVDLTIAIGLINTYNRLSISFRRSPEAVSLK